jgi:ribosomal protein S18 acetylase RimI-like enzyme
LTPENKNSAMLVRELRETDRSWAAALVSAHFGSTAIVSRGVLHDTDVLPGLVAEEQGERIALLQYRRAANQLEIVVLIACRPRQGGGRRLLEAAMEVARVQTCRRLWLITTNDNRRARAFYRAVGWRECAVHRGAVTEARRLKPSIPLTGLTGEAIEDEIEFECLVDQETRVGD